MYYSHTQTRVDDIAVRSTTWRIEDEVGAWEGSYSQFVLDPGADDPNDEAIVTVALAGEGAYDGLIAFTEFDPNQGFGWAIRGVIIEADGVPADPAPAQPR